MNAKHVWSAILVLYCATGPVAAESLVGLNAAGTQLLHFESARPGSVTTVPITGIGAGETLVGIDVRPRIGALYGLTRLPGATDALRLYRIDAESGVATAVAAALTGFDPGVRFGIDFNPAVDRLRVVNSGETNLRLNPVSGALAGLDTDVSPVGQDIVGVAYDRSVIGAPLTTLFGISRMSASLVLIGGVNGTPSPNGGTTSTIGGLTIPLDAGVDAGFDISPGGSAYLSATSGGITRLFTVNLATGAAIAVGVIGNGSVPVGSLAVLPASEPMVALDADARELVYFSSATPERIDEVVSITGLAGGAGEGLVGIDFQPATDALYLVTRVNAGATDTLFQYTVDPVSGVATAVGSGVAGILAGGSYGIGFNPLTNRIMVVNAADENMRLNPVLGVRADTPVNDTDLNAAGQSIDSLAFRTYTGDAVTNVFGISRTSQSLVRIGGVNGSPAATNGAVTSVLALGVTPSGLGGIGFDISRDGLAAFAVMTDAGTAVTGLYRMHYEPATNHTAAALIGRVGAGTRSLASLALLPPSPQIFADGFE